MQYGNSKKTNFMEIKNIFLDQVDSTQKWAKESYLDLDPSNITCITAKEQTKGYGRYERKWLSVKDGSLTTTFYFQLSKNVKDLTTLCQILCLSLAKILIQENLTPKIKWPNDIMLNQKKLSGVLCQTIFEEKIIHIFLGIGININIDKKTIDQIDQPSTSLLIETKKSRNIHSFLLLLQKQFLEDFNLFLKEGFSPFYELFNDLLLYKNKEITLFDGKTNFLGCIDSITPSGNLKLILKSGEEKLFSTGDIFL